MANSETTVGGIVGFLRLEADQFHREIVKALAEIERLDGKKVDIHVDVDRTGAAAKLKETERQVDRLDGSVKRLGNTSNVAHSRLRPLTTAILMLGSGLVPLSAGAVGLAAAFGGMGTAGILAIAGIKREMDAGTATGLAYSAAIGSAKADMQDLAKVAASNVLAPFQDAVADLDDRMPELREQIGDLATVTGKTASALTGGLLAAFIQLEPLMRDASGYVLDLTRRFEGAMSGPGLVAFGDYIRSVFPQVMRDVEAIVVAAGHLVAAFAPLGTGTLHALGTLATLIDQIPVEVLQVLATTAGSVYLGFQTWRGLSFVIAGVSKAIEFLGIQSTVAAGAIRGLQAAAGIIGIAIAALSFIFTANAEAQRANEQAVNDYADALRASNGVVDESIRQMTAKKLADEGVLEAARKLGISLPDVTSAALGNEDAMKRVAAGAQEAKDKFAAMSDGSQEHVGAANDLNEAINKVTGAIDVNNGQLDAGIQKNKDLAAASQAAAGQLSNQQVAVQTLADTYGVSMGTYQSVVTSQQGIADKAAAATLQMQLENDAAGLLKQSLDLLNGETLSAAQTQNSFEKSLATLGDHTTKTGKKVKFTTTSIRDMSDASVTLRGQLLGQVQNAEAAAEAYGQMTGSSEKGRLKLIELKDQIIKNAVAHGIDKDAVTSYINEVFKIPKSVPPTKAEIDDKAARKKLSALQAAINGITGRTVTMTIQQVYKQIGYRASLQVHNEQALYSNGINPNAAGGGIFSGGVRKMAAGDISHPSMIMRSTNPILWNEAPGGEAFISLAPQQRARSLAIHEEVGRIIGARQGGGGGMTDEQVDRIIRGFAKAVRRMPTPEVGVRKLSTVLAGD